MAEELHYEADDARTGRDDDGDGIDDGFAGWLDSNRPGWRENPDWQQWAYARGGTGPVNDSGGIAGEESRPGPQSTMEHQQSELLDEMFRRLPGTSEMTYQATGYDPSLMGRSAYEDVNAAGTPAATAQLRALQRMRGLEGLQLGGAAQARGAYGLDQEAARSRQEASGAGGGSGYLAGLQRATEGRLGAGDDLLATGREVGAAEAMAARQALGRAGGALRDQSFDEAYARGQGIDSDRYADLQAINQARRYMAGEQNAASMFNAQAPSRSANMLVGLEALRNRNYDRAFQSQQAAYERARAEGQQRAADATQVATGVLHAGADRAARDQEEERELYRQSGYSDDEYRRRTGYSGA